MASAPTATASRLLEQQRGGADRASTARVQLRDQAPMHTGFVLERLRSTRRDRTPVGRGEPDKNRATGQRVPPAHAPATSRMSSPASRADDSPSATPAASGPETPSVAARRGRDQHGGGPDQLPNPGRQSGDPGLDQSQMGGRRFVAGVLVIREHPKQCQHRLTKNTYGIDHCVPTDGPGGQVGKIRASTTRYGNSHSSSARAGATRTSASATGRNGPHRAPRAPTRPPRRRP
ncbi:hypothetical protein GCM10023215_55090 [Pseudonocardia yuanmonensis]|uniref:Uncharacterized protein n=1 Tax=Pseudonocardia yuanmonensis TaxID=1095914 RepID=A0ABP8XFU9_9PSEU